MPKRTNPQAAMMTKPGVFIFTTNTLDEKGNPTGGGVTGTGLQINWQNGPLGPPGEQAEPNGAFVESVLGAALQRLQFFQDSRFNCRENALAITKIEEAIHWLESRTKRRTTQGTEGTHDGS